MKNVKLLFALWWYYYKTILTENLHVEISPVRAFNENALRMHIMLKCIMKKYR